MTIYQRQTDKRIRTREKMLLFIAVDLARAWKRYCFLFTISVLFTNFSSCGLYTSCELSLEERLTRKNSLQSSFGLTIPHDTRYQNYSATLRIHFQMGFPLICKLIPISSPKICPLLFSLSYPRDLALPTISLFTKLPT